MKSIDTEALDALLTIEKMVNCGGNFIDKHYCKATMMQLNFCSC